MVEIIEKQRFSVIGKLGEGLSSESSDWIPPLWKEANDNFIEISALAKKDADGNLAGVWGAMSDVSGNFERWKEGGKYLAGCEVTDDAIPPGGWRKWTLPAFKYMVSKCTQETYQDTLKNMLSDYIPTNNYQIVGAIQEFYDPKDNSGELYLYIPIEKI
ncbi:Predicted transcriptional regulator YdeE, contains AraC-type DNA-binding domain [Paenibacillus sp. UNCCL117]|uniref:GyrI-like domain-containing protein n=1 Tax=unclassified Paenibacillus TaxID=185978 RepID=UPI000888D097|nr:MULTISPECIES: GyrI-like domain-containing protein [unclassified Paenibacillus]SDE04687.1 Predicted transcriptional regulator YdeE, contains AraC-type DNA-binding domain [Paenibacillus sp. cl123]SFW57704.1 Predicted transcriptional regulator YdeE, contains AraC-type DNA-binding domain [Paenibacillus sp. UNCCL117]